MSSRSSDTDLFFAYAQDTMGLPLRLALRLSGRGAGTAHWLAWGPTLATGAAAGAGAGAAAAAAAAAAKVGGGGGFAADSLGSSVVSTQRFCSSSHTICM